MYCPLSPRQVGWCHRTDQSAISMIMAKLFRDKYYHFARFMRWNIVIRSDRYNYFEDLKKKGPEMKRHGFTNLKQLRDYKMKKHGFTDIRKFNRWELEQYAKGIKTD